MGRRNPKDRPEPSFAFDRKGSPLGWLTNTYLEMLNRTTSTNYRASTPCDINSKSEFRNPKQTPKQIKLKLGKSKTSNPKEAGLEFDLFLVIWNCFEFRISCFEILVFADFAREVFLLTF